MLASFALDSGRYGHGLDELVKRHFEHECLPLKAVCGTGQKTIRFGDAPIAAATEYAAENADMVWRLWHRIEHRLASEKATRVYRLVDLPLVPVIGQMEREGIKVDRAYLAELSETFATETARPVDGVTDHWCGRLYADDLPIPTITSVPDAWPERWRRPSIRALAGRRQHPGRSRRRGWTAPRPRALSFRWQEASTLSATTKMRERWVRRFRSFSRISARRLMRSNFGLHSSIMATRRLTITSLHVSTRKGTAIYAYASRARQCSMSAIWDRLLDIPGRVKIRQGSTCGGRKIRLK